MNRDRSEADDLLQKSRDSTEYPSHIVPQRSNVGIATEQNHNEPWLQRSSYDPSDVGGTGLMSKKGQLDTTTSDYPSTLPGSFPSNRVDNKKDITSTVDRLDQSQGISDITNPKLSSTTETPITKDYAAGQIDNDPILSKDSKSSSGGVAAPSSATAFDSAAPSSATAFDSAVPSSATAFGSAALTDSTATTGTSRTNSSIGGRINSIFRRRSSGNVHTSYNATNRDVSNRSSTNQPVGITSDTAAGSQGISDTTYGSGNIDSTGHGSGHHTAAKAAAVAGVGGGIGAKLGSMLNRRKSKDANLQDNSRNLSGQTQDGTQDNNAEISTDGQQSGALGTINASDGSTDLSSDQYGQDNKLGLNQSTAQGTGITSGNDTSGISSNQYGQDKDIPHNQTTDQTTGISSGNDMSGISSNQYDQNKDTPLNQTTDQTTGISSGNDMSGISGNQYGQDKDISLNQTTGQTTGISSRNEMSGIDSNQYGQDKDIDLNQTANQATDISSGNDLSGTKNNQYGQGSGLDRDQSTDRDQNASLGTKNMTSPTGDNALDNKDSTLTGAGAPVTCTTDTPYDPGNADSENGRDESTGHSGAKAAAAGIGAGGIGALIGSVLRRKSSKDVNAPTSSSLEKREIANKNDISLPQGNITSPQGNITSPQGNIASPQGNISYDGSRDLTDKNDMSLPPGSVTSPQGNTSSLGLRDDTGDRHGTTGTDSDGLAGTGASGSNLGLDGTDKGSSGRDTSTDIRQRGTDADLKDRDQGLSQGATAATTAAAVDDDDRIRNKDGHLQTPEAGVQSHQPISNDANVLESTAGTAGATETTRRDKIGGDSIADFIFGHELKIQGSYKLFISKLIHHDSMREEGTELKHRGQDLLETYRNARHARQPRAR
ncbi:hypothetical protein Unana1_02197 [Umbelopsis nana]